LVTTLAGLAGLITPPPLATVNVTVTPLTPLPPASVTLALGGEGTAAFTGADCVTAEFALSVVAAPTVPVALNVTGLPVKPVTAAVTALAPAVAPSVQLVSVAMPNAFVLTVAGLTGLSVPPPAVVVNVTTTPATGLPPASVTFTLGGALTAVSTTAVCVTDELAAIVVGLPTMPVAEKTIGLPVSPLDAAEILFAPATAPSVQLVSAAIPLAFVTTVAGLAGLIEPPPPVTVNVTLTPATAVPPASVTFTLGGAVTAEPAVALCATAEFAVSVVGDPTTTESAACPVFPSLVATMFVVPNATAVTVPLPDTVAVAGLELLHTTARPVSKPPMESRATALACVVCPTMMDAAVRFTVIVEIGTGTITRLLEPVTPSTIASTRTAPGDTPRTRPALETTATVLLLDVH
jgi:hypothetical protein